MDLNNYKFYWDNDEYLNRSLYKFDKFDDLQKITINGQNAQELLNNQKIEIKIINGTKNLSTKLYDKYGEIKIRFDSEIVRKIRIAPRKLSKGKKTPKETYDYVHNIIFKDINSFLSYIIENIRNDLKSVDNFAYQLLKEFPKSLDFLVNLLEYNNHLLENSIKNLYNSGPIHKENKIKTDYTGSKLILSSIINPSPYNHYIKQQHTHDTLINRMMFQSTYFMIQASKLIEERLDKKEKILKSQTDKIFQNSNKLLDQYNLWTFYSMNPLDDALLRSKLNALNNPFYNEIYKVYRIIKDIIIYITLISALHLDEGIEIALKEFYTIYEIWSIAKLLKNFKNKGFELENVEIGSFNSISAKMHLKLEKDDKTIILIWEIHLDALKHSTYYGNLIKTINQPRLSTQIKPDITIILQSPEFKKAIIGDVKFSLKENPLPKLESLYKIISYVEDLKCSPLFENHIVEGILIYPGDIDSTKIPEIGNENQINITPLNMFKQDFEIITKIQ